MRRSVRNGLAELLLRAFEDPRRRDAILWLRVFCDLVSHDARAEVPLADLLRASGGTPPVQGAAARDVLACLIDAGGLFRVRRADTGEELQAGGPAQPTGNPWVIGLGADATGALTDVCQRATTYASLLNSLHAVNTEPRGPDPLRLVVAQAAACFNAGLFFETHEHLEQFWRSQPRGQTRRFLQGLIQISVGFHHAQRGSYDGAVNQLTKGLEKAAGVTGDLLGLDCDTFLPMVAKTRDAIVAGGREAMRPMPLNEIPRMAVSGANYS